MLRRGVAAIIGYVLLVQSFPAGAQGQLRIIVDEGNGAINNIRQRATRDFIVHVFDGDNQPVSGAQVTFTLPESGPSGAFPSGRSTIAVTNATGEAIAKDLQPNNFVGQYQIQVTALYEGQTGQTAITQTNAAPPDQHAKSGPHSKLRLILILMGAALAGAILAVELSDR